ncbi:uncharacterized protein LOC110031667 [Phalaenopsis equestris]|uniref:uncharacterized protein LOC110031667 n=1 Tax=Phalaenopsis equestris TaxID=78828 RepID=UPI0009E3D1C4|nr:uncharacterized protein LOC110031667 [Phalaenopsis equestris]
MVLRKMLDRLRSRGEPKNGSEELKQNGGHGGGDTKKKLRSVRVADSDGIRKASKKTSHLPPEQDAAEVPNYMKSTSSYDARKEKNKVVIHSSTSTATATTTSIPLSSAARDLVRNSSLKLLRASMKKNKGRNLKCRETSSSTTKDSETPNALDLKEDHDASELKVCDYAYCSLHGHKHGAAPSLKRLVSARRKSLKVHKSIKLRAYSSMKKKGGNQMELVEDAVNELFIEIHSKFQEWCEERSSDDAESQNIVNRMSEMKLEDPNDASELQESCSVTSIEDCGDKNSDLSMEDIQIINQFLEFMEKGWQEETQIETEQSKEAESEPMADLNDENNEKDCSSSLVSRSRVKYGRLRRQPSRIRESVREFNPWPPRLVTLQAEPEAEQVNLKHQTVEERKAAEEWMIDFALRKALTRLASVRKTKVPQLVAAFENVMPQMSGVGTKRSYP